MWVYAFLTLVQMYALLFVIVCVLYVWYKCVVQFMQYIYVMFSHDFICIDCCTRARWFVRVSVSSFGNEQSEVVYSVTMPLTDTIYV